MSKYVRKGNWGGKRTNAGRKQGMIQKLSGKQLLDQIEQTCGKRFEVLLAEHYKRAYTQQDWNAVRDYEKTILSKVVADKHEIDHTTNGESLNAQYYFQPLELQDWKKNVSLPTVEFTTIEKD